MSKVISKPIKLVPGSAISYKKESYIISNVLDLESVIATNIKTKISQKIMIKDITPETGVSKRNTRSNLDLITDPDWKEANRRFDIIKPILDTARGNRLEVINKVSIKSKASPATLYRWVGAYEEDQRISSLLRPKRNDKGLTRVNPQIEKIIKNAIEEVYLKNEQPTTKDVWDLIKGKCVKRKLKAPHPNTVRNRISILSDEVKLSKRRGKDEARNKFEPSIGHFPDADYPLAVVQIDHTPMDLIVVDDVDRKPIGKPNLTLALDVNSKVVPGYYIGLDPVGALSTGLCITHAILPKETWLAKMDITTPYPIWGKMKVIHTDNAREFHGTMLGKACEQHNIVVEKRPKGKPEYGGHVERAFRTFMSKVHTIPGTTRSNVKDKGDYDSEGKACMTLDALEQWFAIFIVEHYSHRPHAGNDGIPPIVKFENGILGDEKKPGIGIPERITDEYKLKLDFMPFDTRTVQNYGVLLHKIYYFHDGLRRWMHAVDPKNIKNKQQFICRYDPRDLSKIYFYEPDTENYIEVPYRDLTRKPISIWELREVNKRLKEEGYSDADINEELIFGAILKMDNLVKSEVAKTKAARKREARQKGWGKAKEYTAKTTPKAETSTSKIDPLDDIFSGDILPFDDIEEAK